MPEMRSGLTLCALAWVLSSAACTPSPPTESSRIRDIQGAGHISPRLGRDVSGVPGVVTASRGNGFWVQDTDPDADAATSEAIFVYVGAAPRVRAGDLVSVSGVVSETRPSGDTPSANLTVTHIRGRSPNAGAEFTVMSTGNRLPDPVLIGAGGRAVPSAWYSDDAAGGDVEAGGPFDPDQDAIDFWESLEGMRVRVPDATVVGPRRRTGTSPGSTVVVVPDGGRRATPMSARGALVIGPDDSNPERVIVTNLLQPMPAFNVGDRLAAAVDGVVDYGDGVFWIHATSPLLAGQGNAQPRESAAPPRPGQLSVAAYNVLNLDPSDSDAKYRGLADTIVRDLQAPDLIAISEVQDSSGPANDGTVDATKTVARLTASIRSAGGPGYEYRDIPPVNNQDGGEPGGNIRVGFLFRTDRGLGFVERPGGGSQVPVALTPVTGGVGLTNSPGRIAPRNGAFNNSRKPLAGEFTWRGRTLFVIAAHLVSKGADTPLMGRFQPPAFASEANRARQADLIASFVRGIHVADPDALVIVLGDLNDHWFSEPLRRLESRDLRSLGGLLPTSERYTYVYQGNAQTLDHILVSEALFRLGTPEYDIVHVHAEYADAVSDHDPVLARFEFR